MSSAPLMSSRRCRVQPTRALESSVGRDRGRQVRAEHVVPAVVIAGGQRLLFAAALGARLAPAVVAVAREEAVVGAEVVIDAGDARGVGVEARVARARRSCSASRRAAEFGVTMYFSRLTRDRVDAVRPESGCPGNGCGTPLTVFSGS